MIFYTGSYTLADSPALHPRGEGISCFTFDQNTGQADLLWTMPQRNPSYLVVSGDLKYLYALEELPEDSLPNVHAYTIEENGRLRLLNTQKLVGAYGCHLALVAGQLIVANYLSGNAACFPILQDGRIDFCRQLLQHEGTGSNRLRQQSSHIHMVYPAAKDGFYLVDLGLDNIRYYEWDQYALRWMGRSERDIHVQEGAGARHMVLDRSLRFAYVLGELSGEIYVMEQKDQQYIAVQKISIVPEKYKDLSGGATIRMHPNGKYLYASSRGSDTIAIFQINLSSGLLSLVGHQQAGGRTPRDFHIDPQGNWLISALQDADSLVVFAIDTDGKLREKQLLSVRTPVNICWLHPRGQH